MYRPRCACNLRTRFCRSRVLSTLKTTYKIIFRICYCFFRINRNYTKFKYICIELYYFFFSSRRRHTRFKCDWSSDVCSSDLTWLRDRARGEQPARNQRLQRRIPCGVESAPPADRGTSRKGKSARRGSRTDRGAPDARREARTLTRSDAIAAQGNGSAVRQSTGARCRSGAGAKRAAKGRTRRESHRPGARLLAR